MKASIVYTFPLLGPPRRLKTTSLQLSPEGIIAFNIKAPLDYTYISSQPLSSWQYFQFDIHTQKMSHQGVKFPTRYVHEMVMTYNKEKSRWMIGTYDPEVAIYELYDANMQPFVVGEKELNDKIGIGGKRVLLLESQGNICNFIFSVEDIAEVDAPTIFWSHYNYLRKDVTLQQIDASDITVPYVKNNSYLFFQCQRLISHISGVPFSAEQMPMWSIVITAYTAEGSLVHKEFLSDVSFPIHDRTLPEEDLVTWLDCRVVIANDLYQDENNQEVCVAAIALEDSSQRTQKSKSIKGGLFLTNLQGIVLKSLLVELGTKVSLCVCDDKVIGTDISNGVRRLWSWSPQENKHLEQHTSLSQDIKRTTLIPVKSEGEKTSKLFWCIEEYATDIRVSQWNSTLMKEVTFLWYKGITLLDPPQNLNTTNSPQPGLIAFQNKMYILGIYEKKSLQLLQFQ